jgi:hypothetical protein
MIVTRSSSDVRRILNPPREPGRFLWTTGFIGKNAGAPAPDANAPPGVPFPDAYLVEQGPHVSGPAHFHRADEFQIVMSGAGTFGRKHVQPFAVHYAGAYTPYGPIDAGPEGLGYLTLRAAYDPGARTMPANRDELRAAKRKPRAHLVAVDIGRSHAVLEGEPDGLAAWLYHVPAGSSVVGPDPAHGAGQFWIALNGAMRTCAGALLPSSSCMFVSVGEPAQRVDSSTAAPLDVLVVQFPVDPAT